MFRTFSKYFSPVSLALALVVATASPAHAATWKLAPGKTSVRFKVSHFLLSTVKGKFKKHSGTVTTPANGDFTKAKVEADIEVASIDTGNRDRDTHLKQPVFFNAAKFPKMKFRSTKITKVGKNKYKMAGTIDIRGTKRPITLDVMYTGKKKFPNGKECCDFLAKGSLNRYDFGLKWNELTEAGGVAVGELVTIEIKASMIQA